MRHLIALTLTLVLGLALTVAPAVASDEVRLRADLEATEDGGDARGDAEWRQRIRNGEVDRTRFEARGRDIETDDGTGELRVTRDDVEVFSVELEIEDGEGRLRLRSDNGDEVPDLEDGDVVEIYDPDGVLVLTGTLEED